MNDQLKKMNRWLNEPTIDPDVKQELLEIKEKDDEKEIADRFYRDMAFGTGGLRGQLGAGTNRMNVHTVRRVAQAFADHILTDNKSPSVAIAYDNRRNSDLFTYESACVFAANGIRVFVFAQLTPTPMLSYAVRSLGTDGGVVITASHNSREYNGYKIYDRNGCQCLPDEALAVSDIMDDIDIFEGIKTCSSEYSGEDPADKIKNAVIENELINYVPDQVNNDYYREVMDGGYPLNNMSRISVVFTPLNGTGAEPVTKVLKEGGIGKLYTVGKQMNPDPDFASCPQPNPEEDNALREGLLLCEDLGKTEEYPDLLLATDPDCDRVGIMVRDGNEYVRIDGNQTGVLIFDYIINNRIEIESYPQKPVLITTVVSTPMVDAIAFKKRIHTDKVLTGFKYIGAKIGDYEAKNQKDRFIFGFEESCGYLTGTYVRDKDAVSTALLISEMVGFYKKQKMTLVDRMNELYAEYGYYLTKQRSIERIGKKGAEQIHRIMDVLREPETLTGFSSKVIEYLDYEKQTKRSMGLYDDDEGGCSMAIGTKPIFGLPKENMLEFNFSNHSKIIIRPSGTEPKIKIYLVSKGRSSDESYKILSKIESEILQLINNV